MGTILFLLMIVKADGRLFASACFLCSLAQGMQTGFYCADGGQQSENSEYDENPDPKLEPVLNPYPQTQEKKQGEDDGQAELAYPHQKIQNFHKASGENKE
jgi:hypothetical protein